MEGELDAQTDLESLADFFESALAGISAEGYACVQYAEAGRRLFPDSGAE
jgi:hypothetical protein